jgi:hypothetical protein
MKTALDPRCEPAGAPAAPAGGAEPIPGYQLLERLGSGGYGEVWKALAPGGIAKAVKIVFGDLTGPRAEQELRALERIRSVRHPFLLSLERYEVTSSQLVIVTELADCSLMQRFQQCRDSGLPGIPRDELLGYLREAADCLDYLNETHGLQHLDIKPENLLLLSGHMKVADFGLVKNLLGNSASITGGVTPIYATPEAFDGRVSRFSDQYSLAIVFQEMLTGQRPFDGTTPLQLVAQHTGGTPQLSPLPPADRPVIARALSKAPEKRFPLCRHMIEALTSQPAGKSRPVRLPGLPPREQQPRSGARTVIQDRDARGAEPSAPAEQARPEDVQLLYASPGYAPPVEPPGQTVPMPRPLAALSQEAARTLAEPHRTLAGRGCRPTLYIGLGGLAGQVLRHVKGRLLDAFADRPYPAEPSCAFRFLHVDTDRASLNEVAQVPGASALGAEEVLHCPLRQPEQYREQAPDLFRWLPRRWLYGIPKSLRTEGLRPLGRLAIVDHAAAFLAGVRWHLQKLVAEETRAAAELLGLRSETPRVIVVASLTGGTGGGMLIDAAQGVRQVLQELKVPAEISAMLFYATGQRADQAARARINACATLKELWHWSQSADTPPPFTDCYLVGHPGKDDAARPYQAENVAGQLAEYLGFDAIAGACLERLRGISQEPPPENEEAPRERMTVRACGFASAGFARRRLLELAGEALCRRLGERWRGGLSEPEAVRLGQVAVDWVRQQGLSEEALLRRLLGRLPDLLTPTGSELYDQLSNARAVPPAPGSAEMAKVLGRLDAEFGVGPEADAAPRTSAVETACKLEAKEVASALGRTAVERLRAAVEDPGCRLRGGEVALAAVTRYVSDEIQKLRSELERLRVARRGKRQRLKSADGKASGLLPTRMRRLFKESAAERPAWGYFCLRVEEILAECVLDVLVQVQADLAAWGQELDVARRNLVEFVSTFPEPLGANVLEAERPQPPGSPTEPRPPADGPLLELWPDGAADLGEGLSRFLRGLPDDLPRRFDEQVQREDLDAGGGLWWALKNLGPSLTARISRHAAAFLRPLLDDVDLAGLLRHRYGSVGGEPPPNPREEQPLRQAIQDRVRAAQAAAPGKGEWGHLVVVVPPGPEAAPLREAAREALRGVATTVLQGAADNSDELLVAWEAARLSLPEVTARLAGDDPAVAELSEKVRTRQDVEWARW